MKDFTQENEEYHRLLFDKEIGKEARQYLISRGITAETARAWKMGFCPKGYIPNCYKNVTLKSNFYEKMHGRITFPVYDSNGNMIAISGRTIYDEKPKYIHYQCPTHQLLFGLWINKHNIFQDNLCVFVEGQLDVISAWQQGFRNCVCTFGAHFSVNQVIFASRYCNRLAIIYDNDKAGKEGVKNSLSKLKNKGDMDIRNYGFFLKENEDMDDWIKNNDYHKIINYFNKSKLDILKQKLLKMKK